MASKAMKEKGNEYQSQYETLIASHANVPNKATIKTRQRYFPTVAARMNAAISAHSRVARNWITNWLVIIGSPPLGWTSSSPDGPALNFAVHASFISWVWCA